MTNERTIVSPLSPADTNEEIVKDRVIERALERMPLFGNDVKKKYCKISVNSPNGFLSCLLLITRQKSSKKSNITRKTLTFERVKPPRSFILYLNCDVF